jgi:phospholipid/cholesterol/gamma-HCH transport system permease protein
VSDSSAAYALHVSSVGTELIARGDWTALSLRDVPATLQREIAQEQVVAIDISQLGRVDSAGAYTLLGVAPPAAREAMAQREDLRRLIAILDPVLARSAAPKPQFGLVPFFAGIGRAVVVQANDSYQAMSFVGETVVALLRTFLQPGRLRLTPLVSVMHETGLRGIPITVTMNFFVGAVIALIGVNILADYGVSSYTVEMVGVAILREFGVVIAAVLLAGRSASSFAAEIGAMRMNQEVDAIRVMGIDVFDALVVPRVLGALIMMPLMTFCSDIGGLIGGLLASWATLGITPAFFLSQTLATVEIQHFWIGMGKAPFLAVVIAATGCRQGFLVKGDTRSLGKHVTAAVVQSVFLIIMFDAIFAMIFTELDI